MWAMTGEGGRGSLRIKISCGAQFATAKKCIAGPQREWSGRSRPRALDWAGIVRVAGSVRMNGVNLKFRHQTRYAMPTLSPSLICQVMRLSNDLTSTDLQSVDTWGCEQPWTIPKGCDQRWTRRSSSSVEPGSP
jgi:hypothetical protein